MPKDTKATEVQPSNPSARNNAGTLFKTPTKSSTAVNGPTSATNGNDSANAGGTAAGSTAKTSEAMVAKPVEINA